MGFFAWMRDGLGFPPLQGEEDGRRTYRGLAKLLGLGMDNAAQVARQVADEFTPQTCRDESLEGHGQERGLAKLPGQAAAQYRAEVASAKRIHDAAGRRWGMERAIQRATDKPFSLTFYNRDCLKVGRPFGSGPVGGGDKTAFTVRVDLLDQLTDEELAAVQASVTDTGQALRDEVVYIQPPDPLGALKCGGPFYAPIDNSAG